MSTCQECRHWRAGLAVSRYDRAKGEVRSIVSGECRRMPPTQDFKWPKTEPSHSCGEWAGAAKVSKPSKGAATPPASLLP